LIVLFSFLHFFLSFASLDTFFLESRFLNRLSCSFFNWGAADVEVHRSLRGTRWGQGGAEVGRSIGDARHG
jgi:hypothetical protein